MPNSDSAGASMKTPIRIGITMGDPNGIGPEVALKAALKRRWPTGIQIILVGSAPAARWQAAEFGLPSPPLWDPDEPRRGRKVFIWDPSPAHQPVWRSGRIEKDAAEAAVEWIRMAVLACRAGCFDAMVTAPISKEGFLKAGIDYPGHTEMLAKFCGVKQFAMMLFGGPLRIALVTRHVPLANVSRSLTTAEILKTIRMTGRALPWLGSSKQRIAVCGLNPHAGDGGKIGREEITVIEPAIRKAKREGFDVSGPVPADVVFHQALQGKYDAIVSMYHDQGLGPLKMLAFNTGVNITLGLPVVRTSPDHGTAFDIAGKGIANPASMIEAIRWAIRLARRKNPWS
jgi:4-hydroxythreonine-4-phosphate dehydrogenase